MAEPKKVNFRLIVEEDNPEPFLIMQKVRDDFHPDIDKAKIALAWSLNVKSDPDGHVMLGKCIKATDLQRELVEYDFCILLNKEVWESDEFTREKKTALMDHELMHADRALTADGDAKYDERGRPVWRIRGHDIEEFGAIVRRHGCYKNDLEMFAQDLLRRRANPLFEPGGASAAARTFAEEMQALVDRDGHSILVSSGDGELVAEFTPQGKPQ